MRTNSDTPDSFVKAVTEVRALQRYMIEALELQQHEQDLKEHLAAYTLVEELLDLLPSHITRLDQQIALLPGSRDALRISTTAMSGAFIHFLNKTRSRETATMLRDDFTLLNVAAINYLMLHTSASALGHPNIAEAAAQNHGELRPIIQQIAQLLPDLVIHDLGQLAEVTEESTKDRTQRLIDATATLMIDALPVPA